MPDPVPMTGEVFGFDPAALDDVPVVVMKRGPRGWQVVDAQGENVADLVRQVIDQWEIPARGPSLNRFLGWQQEIARMQEERGDVGFVLDEEQRAALAAMFERHVMEGKVSWQLKAIA